MKTLKFFSHLVNKILIGEKTSTMRLFDDKDLTVGDELIFINTETGEKFGEAEITSIKIKTLGSLTDDDCFGNGKFSSKEEMYEIY